MHNMSISGWFTRHHAMRVRSAARGCISLYVMMCFAMPAFAGDDLHQAQLNTAPSTVSAPTAIEPPTLIPAPAASIVSSNRYPETGDKLELTVFDHNDLHVVMEVSQEGFISVPLLGNISVIGKTIGALTEDITALYNKDYLVEPKVTLEIVGYRPIFVMGQVNTPGSYDYESGLSVRKAVALAGGFTARASDKNIKIIRKLNETVVHGDGDMDATLMPGDTVEIGRRWF